MTDNKNNVVNFSISKVLTEQFAIIEEAFTENKEIKLNSMIQFAIDQNNKQIGAIMLFQFEQQEIPFLKINASVYFSIAPESWSSFQKDSNIVIPKGFVQHIAAMTVGTIRGILHTKTEGTRFNQFLLPIIDLTQIIKEDVLVEPVMLEPKATTK